MKKVINILFAITFAAIFSSCNEWLSNTVSKDNITDESIWENADNVDLYVNGFYTYLNKYGPFGSYQFGGSLTESLTDTYKYGSIALGNKAGHPNDYVTNPEAITPGGCLYGIWATAYNNIRRMNEFLVSMQKYSKFTEEQNSKWEAQVKFFRAFVYFQLAKRHPKGVILYTDLNMTNDKARSSADEMWDLIENDLDYAAKNLPLNWDTANKGRVTKGAALAFKSRAMLYAERWQDAYDAAQAVIDLGQYGLMDSYQEAYSGGNKESILEFRYDETGPYHTFDQDNVPMCDGWDYGALGTPTQEMVECYEDKNGNKVDWSGWHDGTNISRPEYENLEPRFQASIIYNGCTWKGNTMDCSVGGAYGEYMKYGSSPYSYGKTTTGYFLRKMVSESHTDLKGINSTQTWVEIRFAEVLLNKSEAAYHLGKSSNEYQSPMNEVRQRVGLPGKTSVGDEWLDNYRNERKVELAYEGHLFWDMRRWKLAATEYTGYRVHGFEISGNKFNYIECDLKDRRFLTRLYCLPIPDSELSTNKLLVQYEEWL